MNYKLAPIGVVLLMCLLASCSKTLSPEPKNTTIVQPKNRVSLSVEASATRCVYSRFGIDAPENNMQEYVIAIRVKNTGGTAVEWTETVTAFVPMNGPPLVNRIVRNGNDQPGVKSTKQNILKYRLEPGQEIVREARSNGYTDSLLKDSGGAPLQLHLDFVSDGMSVTPRFITDLPELQTLPVQPDTPGVPTQGKELEFRRGPAKTGQPEIGYLEV